MSGKRVKVLHLVEDMRVGGLETVIASLIVGIDRNKYEAELCCLSRGGELADRLRKEGVPVSILGMPARHALLFAFRLAPFLRRKGVGVLHCHGYTACTVGRVAALLARVPVIIAHQHSVHRDYSFRQLVIEHVLGRFSDRIICCSKAVRDFVVKRQRLAPGLTAVIYNGTEPHGAVGRSRAREAVGLPEQAFVVGEVASLVPNKGQLALLKAVRILADSGKKIHVVLVGAGPMRSLLEHAAVELGLAGRVIFAGQVENVYGILDAFDVLALPSVYREGLSLALVEGMAMGKPLLASDLDGIRELVEDGRNGLLVPPGDAETLAAALGRLESDASLRAELGRSSRELYERRFTLEHMLKETEAVYADCLAKG